MAYQDEYKNCIWMDFETLERFMKDALVCFGVPRADAEIVGDDDEWDN